jgi:hypothetical protein
VPVDTVLGTLVGAIVVLGVTAVAVIAYQRGLDKLRRVEHKVPLTPMMDGEDDPLRLEFHPDGTPRAIRIRGPHCRY